MYLFSLHLKGILLDTRLLSDRVFVWGFFWFLLLFTFSILNMLSCCFMALLFSDTQLLVFLCSLLCISHFSLPSFKIFVLGFQYIDHDVSEYGSLSLLDLMVASWMCKLMSLTVWETVQSFYFQVIFFYLFISCNSSTCIWEYLGSPAFFWNLCWFFLIHLFLCSSDCIACFENLQVYCISFPWTSMYCWAILLWIFYFRDYSFQLQNIYLII